MTLEEIRDNLLKEKYAEKQDANYSQGYIEGVLDMYNEAKKTKAEAILEAIRKTKVGNDIILHNTDMSIWCILTMICKEHEESKEEH